MYRRGEYGIVALNIKLTHISGNIKYYWGLTAIAVVHRLGAGAG